MLKIPQMYPMLWTNLFFYFFIMFFFFMIKLFFFNKPNKTQKKMLQLKMKFFNMKW